MQERGNDIRTFMPRYGVINERRNQLHEVIRLSGMNLIINDNDHQLIIKVASIPSARVQIYFIDNDDYFSRKGILYDPLKGGALYPDNDERAIFFARGVLETVRKLRWQPNVVHCHGWFSSVAPIYLKNNFSDDPLFDNLKIVVSLYDDDFKGMLDAGFKQKVENEGIKDPRIDILQEPSYQNVMKLVIDYADGVVIRTENPDPELLAFIKDNGKKVLDYKDSSDEQYLNNYQKFYEELL
jgi:starch synthase